MKSKNLKRLAALILCAVLCLTAVACGKRDGKNDIASSSSSDASERETIEAGNAVESVHNENDVAQTKESAAPQQAVSPAKATEKSTEKKTEKQTEKQTGKQTEKQTAAPKAESQTTTEKGITEEDLKYLASELSLTLPDGTKITPKVSAEGKKITVCYTTDINEKLLPGIQKFSESSSHLIFRMSQFRSIDSILFEFVGTDRKVIWSQEYKREA